MLGIKSQQRIYDIIYSDTDSFERHITADKLIRYLRDRRLNHALQYLRSVYKADDILNFSVLVVCGGIGGEAFFFKKEGFRNITNSDLSFEAVKASKMLDSSINAMYANAEDLPFNDSTYDIVIVQDGLHHIPRPFLGFTEMLRVAKKAVIVIEPKESLIGNLIGTQFEKQYEVENYVFRWSKYMFSATTCSYLLRKVKYIKFISLWDHNFVFEKLTKKIPKIGQLFVAKFLYAFLSIFNFCGNMMIGIVIKEED